MLSGRLPTGSVSVSDGRATSPGATDPPDARTRAEYERRIAELEAAVESLESELERREEARREIIARYEWTLDERKRAREEPRPTRRVETAAPDTLGDRVRARVSALCRRLGAGLGIVDR
jgi:chromosome segregation ATPase